MTWLSVPSSVRKGTQLPPAWYPWAHSGPQASMAPLSQRSSRNNRCQIVCGSLLAAPPTYVETGMSFSTDNDPLV